MLKYLNGYDSQILAKVQMLIEQKRLGEHLLSRYHQNDIHKYTTDKALYDYIQELKTSHLKSSPPIAKVLYDAKIHDLKSALGTHTFITRVQGGKLKAKNEIRISHLFKKVPEAFLRMIVAHELAHLKEKEHNKAFYKLCTHIEPAYHQLEFDVRLYLIHLEHFGKLYES
ncbi:MAG TPA: metal-dependent hydrolase [Sulfurovum sp. UBA12169]|nr:MAG TPA: metal-dependent hydrolase [Sulfurovum sp. UBA12169]